MEDRDEMVQEVHLTEQRLKPSFKAHKLNPAYDSKLILHGNRYLPVSRLNIKEASFVRPRHKFDTRVYGDVLHAGFYGDSVHSVYQEKQIHSYESSC